MLGWLVRENYMESQRRKLFRTLQEEEEMKLMPRPRSVEQAYGLLGLTLGTFPPAAIFIRLFGDSFLRNNSDSFIFVILLLAMNLVCAVVGYGMGRVFGKLNFQLERSSWTKLLLLSPLVGLLWGIITGAAGGLVFFGIGALFGPIFAIPVSMVAFPIFAILHRLLERGGMIERRHSLPLAFGVSLTITAFILGI